MVNYTCSFHWKLENKEVTTHSFTHSFHTYSLNAYCVSALGSELGLHIRQQLLEGLGKEGGTIKISEGSPRARH